MKTTATTTWRVILILLVYHFSLATSSAQVRFGWFSYSEAFKSMPEYATVQRQLDELRAQYQAETKRAEEDFNKKYEDFLDVQRELAPTILQKRQTELQEIMTRNLAFKQEARRLLEKAEQDALAPLRQRLAAVLQQIGSQRGYAFILNTDNDACPYINPAMGDDLRQVVKEALAHAPQ